MTELTREQMLERERISNEIIDEILNEEGIEELQELSLHKREKHDQHKWYWESDKEFLARGHNHKAAAILLGIYLRVMERRNATS